ncbi:MAG: hypothetical protein AAGD05_16470 [Bacteroidota bacterium]
MSFSIFKHQEHKKDEIEKILQRYRGSKAWSISQNAFREVMRNFVHGGHGQQGGNDDTLDGHFEHTLLLTKKDVEQYKKLMASLRGGDRDPHSPYYTLEVAHTRHDQFFATNQERPITGTGNQTLDAKFNALNLYEKCPINATSAMPPRVEKSPFPTWDSIVNAMTDQRKFQEMFHLTDRDQANAVFDVTSALDWTTAQGELLITPNLAFGSVFSPALFSVYFFGPSQGAPMNIFVFVTADGFGNPEKPFIGLVPDPSAPKKTIYASINRFAFTYLSSKQNPAKYWLEIDQDNPLNFTLNTLTFFTPHPNSPYIEVNANFSAHAPALEASLFRYIPGVSTFLMLEKATLMRDLVKAYYPDSTSLQLWNDIGAIKGTGILDELMALGLDLVADIFEHFVWEEKPTVS